MTLEDKLNSEEFQEFLKGRVPFLNPKTEIEWKPLDKQIIKYHQKVELRDKSKSFRDKLYLEDGLYKRSGKIWILTKLINYLVYQAHISNYHTSKENDKIEIEDTCWIESTASLKELIDNVKHN